MPPHALGSALESRASVVVAIAVLVAACGADDDAGLSSGNKGIAGGSGRDGAAGAATAGGTGGGAGRGGDGRDPGSAGEGGAAASAGSSGKGGAAGKGDAAGKGGADNAQPGQGGSDGDPSASSAGATSAGTGGATSGGSAGAAGQGTAGAGGGACEGTWTAIPGLAGPTVFAYANETLDTLTTNGISPKVARIAPGETAWTIVSTAAPLYDEKPVANVSPGFEPWSLSLVGGKLVHVYGVRYNQSRSYRAAVIDPLTGAVVKLTDQLAVNDFTSMAATVSKVVAFGGWYGGFEQNGSCYAGPLTDVFDPATVTHAGGGAAPLLGRERALAARAGEQVLFFGGQVKLKGASCKEPNPVIDYLDDGAFFDPATNLWGPRLQLVDQSPTAIVSLGARVAVLTVGSICDVGPGEAVLSCFQPGVAGYGVLGGDGDPIVHFATDGGFVSANLLYQVSDRTDLTAKTVKPICQLPTKLESKYDPVPARRFAAGSGERGVVWGSGGGLLFER